MRLEILLTAILFFGGAFFAGYGLRRVIKLHKEGFLFSIVAGVMVWWALMELILVPMTMKLASFHNFVMVYTIVAGMVSLAGGVLLERYSGRWERIAEELATVCDTGTSGGTGIDLLSVVVSSPSYVSGVG